MERKTDWIKYLSDSSYVEHRKLKGWKDYLPFHLKHCPRHGAYTTYPHGYYGSFPCPKCLEEKTQK